MKGLGFLSHCGLLVLIMGGGVPLVHAGITAPTDIPGCALWLDADDAGTVTQSSHPGFVEQWNDKSGNGKHLIQGTLDNKPATGSTSQGGRNVLTFSGNDWLSGSAVLDGGDDDYTIIAVWRPHKTDGAQVILEQSHGDWTHGARAALHASGSSYGFAGEWNDTYPVAFSANAWRMTAMVLDGTQWDNVHLYDNGNARVTGAISKDTQNVGTSGGIRVGAMIVSTDQFIDGDIAEIIVYTRPLINSEVNDVLYYLDQKWSLGNGVTATPSTQAQYEFEGNSLEGWTETGTAFDSQPTWSGASRFEPSGQWFLGTYENEKWGWGNSQGDSPTGELTSPPTTLAGNTVRALIGGGYHNESGSECQLRLEYESSPGSWSYARAETGPNDNTLREYLWNVGDLAGSNVRFRVLDNHSGGWGHINVDSVRLTTESRGSFHTDFSGSRLDSRLIVYRPWCAPGAALNGSGKFRFDTGTPASSDHDLWQTANRAPQLRLPVNSANPWFTLDTHLTSRSYSDIGNHTGLILVFKDPDATHYDFVAYGPYQESGIRAEGPYFGDALNALSGAQNDIYLRIERREDTYRFLYSADGTTWTSIGDRQLSGKTLLYAGLFTKAWVASANPAIEFDYLNFSETLPSRVGNEYVNPGTIFPWVRPVVTYDVQEGHQYGDVDKAGTFIRYTYDNWGTQDDLHAGSIGDGAPGAWRVSGHLPAPGRDRTNGQLQLTYSGQDRNNNTDWRDGNYVLTYDAKLNDVAWSTNGAWHSPGTMIDGRTETYRAKSSDLNTAADTLTDSETMVLRTRAYKADISDIRLRHSGNWSGELLTYNDGWDYNNESDYNNAYTVEFQSINITPAMMAAAISDRNGGPNTFYYDFEYRDGTDTDFLSPTGIVEGPDDGGDFSFTIIDDDFTAPACTSGTFSFDGQAVTFGGNVSLTDAEVSDGVSLENVNITDNASGLYSAEHAIDTFQTIPIAFDSVVPGDCDDPAFSLQAVQIAANQAIMVRATDDDHDGGADADRKQSDWITIGTLTVTDDDVDPPVIGVPSYAASVTSNASCVVTVDITDAGSATAEGSVTLHYGYQDPFDQNSVARTTGTGDGTYTFTIPPQPGHAGETLKFFITAADRDADRPGDAAMGANTNGGACFSVSITLPAQTGNEVGAPSTLFPWTRPAVHFDVQEGYQWSDVNKPGTLIRYTYDAWGHTVEEPVVSDGAGAAGSWRVKGHLPAPGKDKTPGALAFVCQGQDMHDNIDTGDSTHTLTYTAHLNEVSPDPAGASHVPAATADGRPEVYRARSTNLTTPADTINDSETMVLRVRAFKSDIDTITLRHEGNWAGDFLTYNAGWDYNHETDFDNAYTVEFQSISVTPAMMAASMTNHAGGTNVFVYHFAYTDGTAVDYLKAGGMQDLEAGGTDFSFGIVDDDFTPPVIGSPIHAASIGEDAACVVTVDITDATSATDSGATALYYGYGEPYNQASVPPATGSGNGIHTFTLPPQRGHSGDTLKFFIVAADNDADNPGDACSTTNDNQGAFFSVPITPGSDRGVVYLFR